MKAELRQSLAKTLNWRDREFEDEKLPRVYLPEVLQRENPKAWAGPFISLAEWPGREQPSWIQGDGSDMGLKVASLPTSESEKNRDP